MGNDPYGLRGTCHRAGAAGRDGAFTSFLRGSRRRHGHGVMLCDRLVAVYARSSGVVCQLSCDDSGVRQPLGVENRWLSPDHKLARIWSIYPGSTIGALVLRTRLRVRIERSDQQMLLGISMCVVGAWSVRFLRLRLKRSLSLSGSVLIERIAISTAKRLTRRTRRRKVDPQ